MATTNVSQYDVLADMPHKVIHKISDEPTYLSMQTWFKQICTNLIAVKTSQDWGKGKVHLGMLQAPAIFHARNGDFYNPPPNAPPAYPNILPGANTDKCERLRAEHKVLYVHWYKYVHTGRITVNIGAAAFHSWVLVALEDPNEGINGVTVRDVYDYVTGNYATIPQAEVEDNLKKFNEPINTSRTLAVYIRKQELFQEMAEYAHVPITEATMVTIYTKHVLTTGVMDDEWRVWMRLPNDQQTWVRWKTMWIGAYLGKRELVGLTGIAYNGMSNQAQEMEMVIKMVVALETLANSAVQINDTVERLVISKVSLSASLAARDTEISRLLTVITNLSTGGGSGVGCSGGTNNVKTTITPWDPTGYCWTHGYKIHVGHSSATCNKRNYRHDAHLTAKQGDIKGGGEWKRTSLVS